MNKDTFRTPRLLWIYPLICVLLAPSLLWIIQDRRVWPWDQAWYGEVSVNLWFWLTHSPVGWALTLIGGLNSKPPGIVWLGQLFVPLRILGSVEEGLLFSILLAQFTLLLLLFEIGRSISPKSYLIPVAGVMFAASGQLFIGLSHQYFVEPLQCVAVAWMLFIAAKAPEWPNARILVQVIACLILGSLTKTTSPLYCAAPCVHIAAIVLRRKASWDFSAEWKSRVSRTLILLSGILGVLGAVWYYRNFGDVLQHARIASFGAIAVRYGIQASPAVKFGMWARLVEQSFGAPYLSWAVLILACFAAAVFWRSRQTAGSIALVSAIQILILLCTFSLSDAGDVRFLLAVLPFAAVIVMWLCALASSRIAVAVFCAICAGQWILLQGVALGAVSHVANQSKWLLSMQKDATNSEELMRVVRATATPGKHNIVSVEEPWLNSNSAAFFAAKDRLVTGLAGSYAPLSYAETDLKAGLSRIYEIPVQYVITLDEPFQRSPPDFLNVLALPILKELRQGGRYKAVPFSSNKGILVFERNESAGPWTIVSTVFHPGADTGIDRPGVAWWRIHPSRRRTGEPTTLRYDQPLPAHAVFSGYIESCNKMCAGIEMVLKISGTPGKTFEIRLPGPLAGKRIETALDNSAGEQLTVDIHSIDPNLDNIDYCWLTMRDIQVASR
jgi:hypothetical protein